MGVKILAINCSPRKENNTSIMLERAVAGAKSISGVEVEMFDFAGKEFHGCKATCAAYCMKNGVCSIKDDLNDLMERYLAADGVIWAAPVYHVGPPAQVKAALDRIGNVMFSYLKGSYARLNKPCTALVQGSSRWGGQELTIQFFLESFMLLGCIPVKGDMPKSYYGVAGYAPTWQPGSLNEDPIALETAEVAGVRVAEMTKIIRAGIEANRDELPTTYFLDKVLEERRSREEEISMDWQKKK